MSIALLLLVVLVLLVFRAARARGRRKAAGAALSDTLGLVQPYRGPKWKVRTDRWL